MLLLTNPKNKNKNILADKKATFIKFKYLSIPNLELSRRFGNGVIK